MTTTRLVDPKNVAPILPTKKSENTQNDPQKGAFQIQQVGKVLAQIKDKGQNLDEQMDRLKDVLTDVQKAGSVTKSQEREILSLVTQIVQQAKEEGGLVDSLRDNVTTGISSQDNGLNNGANANFDDQNTGVSGGSGSGGISGGIMAGALAEAEAILLELQEKYQQLQQLMTQISIDNLKQTPTVITFMANAAQNSLDMQAQNQRVQMWQNIGQAGAVTATGAAMLGNNRMMEKATAPVDSEIGNLNQYQEKLNTPNSAVRSVNDLPSREELDDMPDTLDPAEVDRRHGLQQRLTARDQYISDMKQGNFGTYSDNVQTREDAINHLSQSPAEKEQAAKILQDKLTQKHTQLSSLQGVYSRREGYLNMSQQLVNNAGQAASAGVQAQNTQLQGAAEAQRAVSGVISDQMQKTTQDNKDSANAQVQNEAAQLQIREKLQDQNNRMLGA